MGLIKKPYIRGLLLCSLFLTFSPFFLFSQSPAPYVERYDEYGRYYERNPYYDRYDNRYNDRYDNRYTDRYDDRYLDRYPRRSYGRGYDRSDRYDRYRYPGGYPYPSDIYYRPLYPQGYNYYEPISPEPTSPETGRIFSDESRIRDNTFSRTPRTECLEFLGIERGGGNSYQLHFYNGCPRKVWAKVCVEEREGMFKLHTSAARIPEYGRFHIFTYEGSPLSVEWSSDVIMPFDPGQCFRGKE